MEDKKDSAEPHAEEIHTSKSEHEQDNVDELKHNIDKIIEQQARDRLEAVQQEKEDPLFDLKACQKLSPSYYGYIEHTEEGLARIMFEPKDDMIMDHYDVVHPSFLDGAAYFCALAAVNQENAIISQATTEFLSPIRKGMAIQFQAKANYNTLSRKSVSVRGKYKEIVVYESTIVVLALEEHIFASSFMSPD